MDVHRIDPSRTCAALVDVQQRLYPHMANKEHLEGKLKTLHSGLKALGIPIVVTEQYPKGLGHTIPSIQEQFGDITPLEKMAFSCADNQAFRDSLSELERDTVVIAGIEAHVCVLQTSMDLLDAGYRPVVVADATSSRSETDRDFAFRRMERSGVVLTTVESILFELCRYSGTDTFKSISKLVK